MSAAGYFLAFFELGGGCVCSMAFSASSKARGANVSLSVLRCGFFFLVLLCTYSLSAPSGLIAVMFYKQFKLAGQPVPSNALPVCEAFPFCLLNRHFHTLAIGNAAVIPTEGKLIRVTVQMLTANMMERSHYPTLEQAEKAFAGINMRHASVRHFDRVFFDGVIHNVMPLKVLFESNVNARLICVYHCLFGHAFSKARPEILLRNTGNDLCPQLPATFRHGNQRDPANILRVHVAFAANKSFINFNGALEQFSERTFAHCKANAMRHKPSAFVSDIQHPVKLMGAHSLFGRAKEENRHQPFANGNVGILKDGSNRDCKLLAAGTALVKTLSGWTFAVRLWGNRVDAFCLPVVLAMGANRTVRPTEGLKQFPSFVVVGILLSQLNKVKVFRTEGGLFNFHAPNLGANRGFVKYIIPKSKRVLP